MKVEKAVGWIGGLDGAGVVYELSHNGQFLLANIWTDGMFHFLSHASLQEHIDQGKGALTDPREVYLAESSVPVASNGSLPVENSFGWDRLYTAPGNEAPGGAVADELVFPVEISFSGSLKMKIAGLSQLLKFVE